jgi:hypothetical protein
MRMSCVGPCADVGLCDKVIKRSTSGFVLLMCCSCLANLLRQGPCEKHLQVCQGIVGLVVGLFSSFGRSLFLL